MLFNFILSLLFIYHISAMDVTDLSKYNDCPMFKRLKKGNRGAHLDDLVKDTLENPFSIIANPNKREPQCLLKLDIIRKEENFAYLTKNTETGFDQIRIWLNIYINTMKLFRSTFNACFESFYSGYYDIYEDGREMIGNFTIFFNPKVFGLFLDADNRIMCKLDYLVYKHNVGIDPRGAFEGILDKYYAFMELVYIYIEKKEKKFQRKLSLAETSLVLADRNSVAEKFIDELKPAANVVFYESLINVILILFEFKKSKKKIKFNIKKEPFSEKEISKVLRTGKEAIYLLKDLEDIVKWPDFDELFKVSPEYVFENKMPLFTYVLKNIDGMLGKLMDLFSQPLLW